MAKIKVIASTGLAPVKALVGSTAIPPGAVFGVTPQRLPALLAKKEVALVAIDDDIETAEVEIEVSAPAASDEPAGEDEEFTLPEGWREQHHMILIRLAKKLDPEVTTKAEAIAVLEAHEASLKAA